MTISRKTLALFVITALQGATLSAQGLALPWNSGPALGAAGGGHSPTANYSTQPIVTIPSIPTPSPSVTSTPEQLPVPAPTAGTSQPTYSSTTPTYTNGAAPVMQPYMPATVPAPGYVPAPGGAPTMPPNPGSQSAATPTYSAGPQSYTMPQYGMPQYNVPTTAQRPVGQTSYGAVPAAAPYAGQEMPPGNLSQNAISPYARPQSPPSQSTWIPTKVAGLMPRSWTGNAPSAAPSMPQAGYGSYPAAPGDQNVCCPPPGAACGPCENWCDNIGVVTAFDAFKNGIDLDGQNANFGKRVGVFGAFPILREWGIGGQAGATAGWYDWKGSQYTGPDQRFQNFITTSVFQRPCGSGFGWGIAYDWLYDDFYADMNFSQFRVAGSYQFVPGNEIGIWASLPQERDETFVGTPAVLNRFETLLQGNLYWRRVWSEWASTNVFVGMAESPSDISYGSNIEVAVTPCVALTGAMEYVLPGSGGNDGRQEEIWNLSLGMTFYPGSAMRNTRSQFRPFLPMADNGNMAIWRR